MYNELLFFVQISCICSMVLGAWRLGKEALMILCSLLVIYANLCINKQIFLFGFEVTATDAFAIGCSLGLNLLQEYYGRALTRYTIWVTFAAAACCTFLMQLHLFFIPSLHDTSHLHYLALWSVTPRIMLASLSTYCIAQFIESLLYQWLQTYAQRLSLVIRNLISISCCQLLDTVLFSFLGLYGIVANLGHIIVLSYLIKMITLVCAAPFLWCVKTFFPAAPVKK